MLAERMKQPMSVAELSSAMNVTGRYGLGESKVLLPDEMVQALAEVLGDEKELGQATIERVVERFIARVKSGSDSLEEEESFVVPTMLQGSLLQ
jgi:hypothetical protein